MTLSRPHRALLWVHQQQINSCNRNRYYGIQTPRYLQYPDTTVSTIESLPFPTGCDDFGLGLGREVAAYYSQRGASLIKFSGSLSQEY